MINAKAIDHICLWVKSLPEAKQYYEKIFGFTCTASPSDKNTLIVESENIHFFISEDKTGDKLISRQHLSFEVESLDQVMSALDEMGISDYTQGEVNYFVYRNYKWCEWRDPSGVRLECVEIIHGN